MSALPPVWLVRERAEALNQLREQEAKYGKNRWVSEKEMDRLTTKTKEKEKQNEENPDLPAQPDGL